MRGRGVGYRGKAPLGAALLSIVALGLGVVVGSRLDSWNLDLRFAASASASVLDAAASRQGERRSVARVVSVLVAPNGNDATCRRASQLPCATFDRAYAIARLGDTVAIAPGIYPAQRITQKSNKTVAGDQLDVVFEPAGDGSIEVQGLEVDGASHLTLKRLRDVREPQGTFLLTNANDVTWENLDAANFYINQTQDITIRGGDWGPCTVPGPCSNSKLDVEAGSRITIENARFHDYRIVPGSGEHFECLIIFGGEHISLINNRFDNCEFYNIFLQHPVWAEGRYNGRTPSGITMRGNVFSATLDNGNPGRSSAIGFSSRGIPFADIQITGNWFTGASSVSVDDDGLHAPVNKFSIARNSFASGRVMVDNEPVSGLSVFGNIAGTGHPCLNGVTYSSNVFPSGTCSPQDRSRIFGYSISSGKLVVVPSEAATVRAVFAAAGERGSSPALVAKTLSKKRPRLLGGWRCRVVDALLHDRVYLGNVYGPTAANPRIVSNQSWRLSRRALARTSACS